MRLSPTLSQCTAPSVFYQRRCKGGAAFRELVGPQQPVHRLISLAHELEQHQPGLAAHVAEAVEHCADRSLAHHVSVRQPAHAVGDHHEQAKLLRQFVRGHGKAVLLALAPALCMDLANGEPGPALLSPLQLSAAAKGKENSRYYERRGKSRPRRYPRDICLRLRGWDRSVAGLDLRRLDGLLSVHSGEHGHSRKLLRGRRRWRRCLRGRWGLRRLRELGRVKTVFTVHHARSHPRPSRIFRRRAQRT